MLDTTDFLLNWPADQPLSKHDIWQQVEEVILRSSRQDLQEFTWLEERGYGDLLLNRYPSLRTYFADFLHLPFAAKPGHEHLIQAIDMVRELDAGDLKRLPPTAPINFVPQELRRALKDQAGSLNRNAWEMGLALAIKDALRSGDLYLPQSTQHVSFWDLMLSETRWQEVKTSAFDNLKQPQKHEAKAVLTQQFHEANELAKQRFAFDDFAEIQDSKLTLKRDDKVVLPPSVKHGQDLPYTGGEFSGLVSKRLNKYQKPSIQAFPEEGFMFSNPRGSYHEMSWQVIRESA